MRSDRRWRSSVTLFVACLVVLSVASISTAAERNCPPRSQAPECTGADGSGQTQEPAAPAEPKADRPGDRSTVHGEEPSKDADPGTFTGDADGSSRSTSSPSGSATSGSGDEASETEEAPPPPPDLGPRRMLSSRLRPAGSALDVEVLVEEREARGVDGGWMITVELDGAPAGLAVTDLRPSPNARAVARAPEGVFDLGAPQRLFAVFGQTSGERYADAYRAQGRVEFLPGDARGRAANSQPPVVVITLFQ